MITKVIDNFSGHLTRVNIGDMNSGLAKYTTSYGYDPFSSPQNLTWLEAATQIDAAGSVITDLIVAARPRLESGITYVYAVGHTGRVYKIQVNDPSAHNPNLDNATLLATLSINSPTFKYGSSIQFFGTTEQLFICHDLGVTSLHFDGTSEAFVGTLNSYTANVPRPSVQFLGVLYVGNGVNLVAIAAAGTVSTYAQLNPALPTGTFIRDMDITPNGRYVEMVVSWVNSQDLTSTTQDTTSLSSSDSYIFLWNGTDPGYTAYSTFGGYSIGTNITFGKHTYSIGYDLGGAAIYTGGAKLLTLRNSIQPAINALMSTGNLLGFGSPETNSSKLQANIMFYGQYDAENKAGLYRFLRMLATSPQTDILQIPVCLVVSNLFYGSSSAGYTNNQVGSAKLYFSTLETSSAPTTKYRFYKFTTVPTGTGTSIGGVYETQNETSVRLFRNIIKRRLTVSEVRFYCQPLVTNNSFQIDIIGSGGTPINNSTDTFTAGTGPATVGATIIKYNPQITPSYSLGLRITNKGSANMIFEKIEMDIDEAGA